MVHTVYALNPLSKGANYCTIQQLKEHCMAAVQCSNQSEYTVRRPYHEVHVIISITNQCVFVFRQLKISQPISNTLNHTTVCKTNIMTASIHNSKKYNTKQYVKYLSYRQKIQVMGSLKTHISWSRDSILVSCSWSCAYCLNLNSHKIKRVSSQHSLLSQSYMTFQVTDKL